MSKLNRVRWILALTALPVFLAASEVLAESPRLSHYRRAPSVSHDRHRPPPSARRHHAPSYYRHRSAYVRYRPTYVYRTYPRPVVVPTYYPVYTYPYSYTYTDPYAYTYTDPYSYTYAYPQPRRAIVVRRYYPHAGSFHVPGTALFGSTWSVGRSSAGWGLSFALSLLR